MRNSFQISVLCIYLFTSCFIVGVNRWASTKHAQELSGAEKLFSILLFEVNTGVEETSDLTFLYKDPSDDSTIELDYYPGSFVFKFMSRQTCFYFENRIKDHFLNIFSPPPQIS